MNRLATVFSIATTVGLVLAVVAGVAWIVAILRHQKTTAKTMCLAGVIVAVVGFAMFLRSYDNSLHQEPGSQPPAVQSVIPEQPQEPVIEPTENQQGNTPAAPQEPAAPLQESEQAVEIANPLAPLQIQTRPVMNGPKTEQIGTWAYIETTKEFMAGVTGQQFHDYLAELPVSDYNWFNVFFENGTGLWTFSPEFVEYGQADRNEGGTVEYIGDAEDCIYIFGDGQYSTEN